MIAATAIALLFWMAFPGRHLTGAMLVLAGAGAGAAAFAMGRDAYARLTRWC